IVLIVSVDEPGAGEDHLWPTPNGSTRLEERQVPPAVDVEIHERVAIRVDIADLRGQAEDVVDRRHEPSHEHSIPDVADDEPELVLSVWQIGCVPTVERQHRVEDDDVRAGFEGEMRDAATQHPGAAGHENATALELGELSHATQP